MRQGPKARKKNGRPDVDLRKAGSKYLAGGLLDGGEIVPAIILAGGYCLDWFESSPPKLNKDGKFLLLVL